MNILVTSPSQGIQGHQSSLVDGGKALPISNTQDSLYNIKSGDFHATDLETVEVHSNLRRKIPHWFFFLFIAVSSSFAYTHTPILEIQLAWEKRFK